MIALDRSMGLLELAKAQPVFSDLGGEHGGGGGEVVRGDLGCRGWRDGVFVCPPFVALGGSRERD
jgi:hypothetical protein